MPKPAVPPKYVNGKDMSDNSENEVCLTLICRFVTIVVIVIIFVTVIMTDKSALSGVMLLKKHSRGTQCRHCQSYL